MKRECDVGYGKPPTHSRFMTGQSGNPKGRPKGSRNFSTDVKATLEEPIRVTHHGKAKTVSTQLAALLRLREKALSGDARALDRLVELARLYNDDDEMAEAATRLDAADTEIVKAHDEKVLRQAGMVQKPHGARKRRENHQENGEASRKPAGEDGDGGELH